MCVCVMGCCMQVVKGVDCVCEGVYAGCHGCGLCVCDGVLYAGCKGWGLCVCDGVLYAGCQGCGLCVCDGGAVCRL